MVVAWGAHQVVGRPLRPPVFCAWRSDPRPLYHSQRPHGSPSDPDTVDLAFGALEHEPDEDLFAPNRFGEEVTFSRIYTTPLAVAGLHEVGMTTGWRHSFSIVGSTANPSAWSTVRFEDPKGAVEEWEPMLQDGRPTGEFPMHPGSGFVLRGEPTAIAGRWASFTWQRNGLEKWVFLPVKDPKLNAYKLTKMVSFNGTTVTLKYDESYGYRLQQIVDNAGSPMFTFQYDAGGLMTSSTAAAMGVSIYYGYSNQAGCLCLTTVSPRSVDASTRDQIFWKYGYEAIRQKPFLTSVGTPVNSPDTLVFHRNVFDPITGKEISYIYPDGTHADIKYGVTK